MKQLVSKSRIIRIMIFMLGSSVIPVFAGVLNVDQTPSVEKKLIQLEAESRGRLGLYAINTTNNDHIQYRADERFPTGCTSKVIGVSAMLKKSMIEPTLLQQKVFYTKDDLTNWNPITEKHVAHGMTVEELCAATISYSDNTAMNLLVNRLGGLKAMNRFARSIGNTTFRQDHDWSDEAKSGGQGDLNDSSTPEDMAKSLQKLALGNVLAQPQRKLLVSWLQSNTTGNARIRAGVPNDWVVGDKTGTGMYYGTTNDIGIIWPPRCAPIVIALYFTSDNKQGEKQEAILARATKMIIQKFAENDVCIKGYDH